MQFCLSWQFTAYLQYSLALFHLNLNVILRQTRDVGLYDMSRWRLFPVSMNVGILYNIGLPVGGQLVHQIREIQRIRQEQSIRPSTFRKWKWCQCHGRPWFLINENDNEWIPTNLLCWYEYTGSMKEISWRKSEKSNQQESGSNDAGNNSDWSYTLNAIPIAPRFNGLGFLQHTNSIMKEF